MDISIFVYAAQVILFVIGVVLCLIPLIGIRSALVKGRVELPMQRQDGSYIYDHHDFLKNNNLKPLWGRYLSNLAMAKRTGTVCDVNEFINHETAISGPGRAGFGSMIPGALTTLGILGSFIGIVRGLGSLDLSSAETMNTSVVILISGMSTAFNTSIVGALLALIFQLLRRAVTGSAENALNAFIGECGRVISNQLTNEASVARIMREILDELRKLNARVGGGQSR